MKRPSGLAMDGLPARIVAPPAAGVGAGPVTGRGVSGELGPGLPASATTVAPALAGAAEGAVVVTARAVGAGAVCCAAFSWRTSPTRVRTSDSSASIRASRASAAATR